MTITLVPAKDVDWPRAWAIQRDAFQELVTKTWGGWTDEQVQKCADAWTPAHTRLITVDGALAGWVHVDRRDAHDWLNLIVIAPSFQRRGLGGEVMRMLTAEAARRAVPLWLSVWKLNRARRLYRRLGFAEHPRDDNRVFMVYPPDAPATAPPSEREADRDA